jgi:outer membrane lipoprotein SlyB
MKTLSLTLVLALSVVGCSRGDSLEIPTGSDVTVQKKDGVTVTGRLVEVQPQQVVLEQRGGEKTLVQRADIQSIAALTPRDPEPAPVAAAPVPDTAATTGTVTPASAKTADTRNPLAKVFDRAPEYREVTIPAGTMLPVALQTSVASDTSSPEDPVRGTLRRAVTIDGVQALRAGTEVLGHVMSANRSAKVKGRASIALRFNQIDLPGDGGRVAISTGTISRLAPATKKQDAAKIGGGAAGGAIIGGILGGGDGAAKGAAIGGAAGTGVVLATRGKEVRLGPGLPLSVRLTSPLTVRVPLK